jgi:hypothetical protein
VGGDLLKGTRAIFGLSVLMSFVASGLVTGLYLVPALEAMATKDALTAIAVIHTYRFIGLAFLVPGVVSENLPREFARPAAYGDLIAAILAVLSTVMLHGDVVGALAVTLFFNIWGTGDLVNAMFQGTRRIAAEGRSPLGATFFIPTVIVPALLITHGLIFWLLVLAMR